jgi:4-oxalocrotonate tautomerase
MNEPDADRFHFRRNLLQAGALIGTSALLAPRAPAQERDLGHKANQSTGENMPLARIDISREASAELVSVVGAAIYGAMVAVADVPANDHFQVVHRHAADEIIYPKDGYLGLHYTKSLIIIQVTWVRGRTTDAKKQFFHRVANEIHEKGGVRKEDVWINLVDCAREDWSFGNGEMQYAPK